MSKMVARLLPHYEFDIGNFFCSDGAPGDVAQQRQDGFFRLARLYEERYAKGRRMTAEAAEHISDLQFTESYRVPFQYSRLVRENLGTGAFMESSAGVTVTDVDGNVFHDLTGSYGVNIFGNDFYKECIAAAETPGAFLVSSGYGAVTRYDAAMRRAESLGPFVDGAKWDNHLLAVPEHG